MIDFIFQEISRIYLQHQIVFLILLCLFNIQFLFVFYIYTVVKIINIGFSGTSKLSARKLIKDI